MISGQFEARLMKYSDFTLLWIFLELPVFGAKVGCLFEFYELYFILRCSD
jgi:hypothetical protein